jgi:NUMOD4 motif
MVETWKAIPGWEGLYAVSNLGKVRREAREVVEFFTSRWGTPSLRVRQLPQRLLKPNIDTGGYAQVVLQNKTDALRVTVTVHRLVLSAFRRLPVKGDHGMHKNDIRHDNRLVNLKWGTKPENSKDMAKKGRKRGGGMGPYMTANQVKAIQKRPKENLQVLADEFKTSKSNISKIRAKARK